MKITILVLAILGVAGGISVLPKNASEKSPTVAAVRSAPAHTRADTIVQPVEQQPQASKETETEEEEGIDSFEAYTPATLATASVAELEHIALQFPRLDHPLSGSWGRVMIAAAQGGKTWADLAYNCYHFRPNGTVTFDGAMFGQQFEMYGSYTVKGNRVELNLFKLVRPTNKPDFKNALGRNWATLGQDKLGQTLKIQGGEVFVYHEGVTWDPKSNCYRDQAGNRLVLDADATRAQADSYAQHFKTMVGKVGDGWTFQDYFDYDGHLLFLIWKAPIEKSKQNAIDWVRKQGLDPSTKKIRFDLIAELRGSGGESSVGTVARDETPKESGLDAECREKLLKLRRYLAEHPLKDTDDISTIVDSGVTPRCPFADLSYIVDRVTMTVRCPCPKHQKY